MKKFLVALALLSSPSYAQLVIPTVTSDDLIEFAPNGVITSITATPANGGINPSFAGVKLEGTIKAGGNACDAQRFEVGIEQSVVDGQLVFTPFVQPKEGSDGIMCIALYDASWKGLGFSQTFVAPAKQLETAIVKDVEFQGNETELQSLFVKEDIKEEAPAVNECSNIPRFCTKEFDPQSCHVVIEGTVLSAKGNNKCEASAALRSRLCGADKAFKAADITCARQGEEM